MKSQHMEKLEKILEYKERINQNVKDVRDLIPKNKLSSNVGSINDMFNQQLVFPISEDVEIKKKIDDISL